METLLKYFCSDSLFRVTRVTRTTEKVANGVLSGVLKVSGYFTSSVANSKVGKKFFGMLPGEVLVASLDGFSMLSALPFSFSPEPVEECYNLSPFLFSLSTYQLVFLIYTLDYLKINFK